MFLYAFRGVLGEHSLALLLPQNYFGGSRKEMTSHISVGHLPPSLPMLATPRNVLAANLIQIKCGWCGINCWWVNR